MARRDIDGVIVRDLPVTRSMRSSPRQGPSHSGEQYKSEADAISGRNQSDDEVGREKCQGLLGYIVLSYPTAWRTLVG